MKMTGGNAGAGWVLALIVGFGTGIGGEAKGEPREARLLIKTRANLESRPGSPGGSIKAVTGLPGWQSIRVPDSKKRSLIRELSEDPAIEWVEEDQIHHIDPVRLQIREAPGSDDPGISGQWSLDHIGVKQAWELVSPEAPEVLVAVVDTGVDFEHPDLASQLFLNRREIPGNGVDDDHNGLVDDVRGWNFEAKNDDIRDDYHHGTHVSGIIGARSGNREGIAGIAPKVRILPLRWTKNGSGWGEDAIAAIHYAVSMGARVINASFGGIGYSRALEEAVREAEREGVLFVASAGNNHSDNDVKPRHPANLRFSNVISVASTDEKDGLEKYSNFGLHQVELGAPGKGILSTLMNRQYGLLSGTSMAAAEVSGVAALLLAVNPALRAQDLKRILISTVDPAPALAGKTISGGRVNALKAARMARQWAVKGEAAITDDSDLSPPLMKEASFYGYSLKPDAIEEGSAVEGMSIRFVRRVKGVDTPVPGLEFKAQTHADGTYQKLRSDPNGWVQDPGCKKTGLPVTITLESPRYRISTGGAPYELVVPLKCGVAQKVVFGEDTQAGQAVAIWQIANRGETRLGAEAGLAFWKRQIDLNWPGRGDYYSADQVNLTAGHHWDVVSHEFGHAIYDQARIGVFGGGQHYIDQCYTEAMAISEGWASYFAGWLNLELSDPDARFEFMVPRRAPIRFETIPADVCGKSTNEWRVIGFFWDLIDTHADGESSSETFGRLWRDLEGMRVPSAAKAREILLQKGWRRDRLEEAWRLNFPGEN